MREREKTDAVYLVDVLASVANLVRGACPKYRARYARLYGFYLYCDVRLVLHVEQQIILQKYAGEQMLSKNNDIKNDRNFASWQHCSQLAWLFCTVIALFSKKK